MILPEKYMRKFEQHLKSSREFSEEFGFSDECNILADSLVCLIRDNMYIDFSYILSDYVVEERVNKSAVLRGLKS